MTNLHPTPMTTVSRSINPISFLIKLNDDEHIKLRNRFVENSCNLFNMLGEMPMAFNVRNYELILDGNYIVIPPHLKTNVITFMQRSRCIMHELQRNQQIIICGKIFFGAQCREGWNDLWLFELVQVSSEAIMMPTHFHSHHTLEKLIKLD